MAASQVTSTYWTATYQKELAELQASRARKEQHYQFLAAKLTEQANILAAQRTHLTAERDAIVQQIAQVNAQEAAKTAERDQVMSAHDAEVTQATIQQRNLENSITEANIKLSEERRIAIEQAEQLKQQQELEQNKVNYNKHLQYLQSSRTARDLRQQQAAISASDSILTQTLSDAQRREAEVNALYASMPSALLGGITQTHTMTSGVAPVTTTSAASVSSVGASTLPAQSVTAATASAVTAPVLQYA
jgi:hypothetical protein